MWGLMGRALGLQEMRIFDLIISCLLLMVSACFLSNAAFCPLTIQIPPASDLGAGLAALSSRESLEQRFVVFFVPETLLIKPVLTIALWHMLDKVH